MVGGVVVGGWFVGVVVGVPVVVPGPVPFGGVFGGHASRVGSQLEGLGVALPESWHPAANTITAAKANIERMRDLAKSEVVRGA